MGSGDTQVEVTHRYLEGQEDSLPLTLGPLPPSLLTPSLSTEVRSLHSALALLGLGWLGVAFRCPIPSKTCRTSEWTQPWDQHPLPLENPRTGRR